MLMPSIWKVVADEEFPYVEMVVEHLLHKLSCRHRSHRLVEMQHHDIIHFRLRKQQQFGIERAQHLRLIIRLQYLAGMRIEGNDGGLQAILSCCLYEMMNQELMSPMHPIEETDGCHTRRQLHGIVIMYCIHSIFIVHIRRIPCGLSSLCYHSLKSSPQLASPKYNGC